MDSLTVETTSAVEVGKKQRRRRWPEEEKLRIVAETFRPGASVAQVALTNGVNANQLFTWRRRHGKGLLRRAGRNAVRLLPVTVTGPGPSQAARSSGEQGPPPSSGTIHLELPRAHLRIDGSADPTALRMVLECLLG